MDLIFQTNIINYVQFHDNDSFILIGDLLNMCLLYRAKIYLPFIRKPRLFRFKRALRVTCAYDISERVIHRDMPEEKFDTLTSENK